MVGPIMIIIIGPLCAKSVALAAMVSPKGSKLQPTTTSGIAGEAVAQIQEIDLMSACKKVEDRPRCSLREEESNALALALMRSTLRLTASERGCTGFRSFRVLTNCVTETVLWPRHSQCGHVDEWPNQS